MTTADGWSIVVVMSSPHKPYSKPAGGWDALWSSCRHLSREGALWRGAGTLLSANQPDGFDCPGCAWPDRNPHSTFEFCENGVKAVAAEATRRRIGHAFFAAHTVAELARWDDRALEAQGRLVEPLRYDLASDRYLPISWDEAFALVGARLAGLDDPRRGVFYTSGRTSNEAAFLYQLMVRELGSNNLPDCSNMCHEPSGVALTEQLGTGKGTVTLDDFTRADAIFVFGQNPGTNHPRMLGELRDAARRGCRIVVFNPLRERGLERFTHPQDPVEMLTGGSTALASHYHQPRIGGDLAVLTGLLKCLVERDAVDRDFIAAHTVGFDALAARVAGTSWDDIERGSGLARAAIEEAASIYRDARSSIVCWGMGITQHRHAVATIQMIGNLLLARGNIGRPGAGACPVRGHSNVQGDRTMGIHEKPSAVFLDRLGREFGFEPPREDGVDVIAAIEQMERGEVEVFVALGGNFAAATPDSVRTQAALRRVGLTVQVSTKLNRSHLVHGREALILPCLGRTEIDRGPLGPRAVTVEDSMSMVHLSHGMNAPAAATLRSEPEIVAGIAVAALPASATPWRDLVADYDRIRARIERVVEGFEDFNRRVRTPGGFHLRNSAAAREWRTASGKARFFDHPLPATAADGAPTMTLMTVRSHDQYNTTIYGLDDRYRGVRDRRNVVFIARADRERLGFAEGQRVDLHALPEDPRRVIRGFELVDYDLPPGCLAAYFPETNPLVALEHHAERARTPASKSIAVRLVAGAG